MSPSLGPKECRVPRLVFPSCFEQNTSPPPGTSLFPSFWSFHRRSSTNCSPRLLLQLPSPSPSHWRSAAESDPLGAFSPCSRVLVSPGVQHGFFAKRLSLLTAAHGTFSFDMVSSLLLFFPPLRAALFLLHVTLAVRVLFFWDTNSFPGASPP